MPISDFNVKRKNPWTDQEAGYDIWSENDTPNDDDTAIVKHDEGMRKSLPEILAWNADLAIQKLPVMNQRGACSPWFIS
jgi:hypothetical protein